MSDTGQFAAAITRYAAGSLLPHSRRYTPDRQATSGGEFHACAKLFHSPGYFAQSMSRTTGACNRAGQQVI
jgi:hypothetical protein